MICPSDGLCGHELQLHPKTDESFHLAGFTQDSKRLASNFTQYRLE